MSACGHIWAGVVCDVCVISGELLPAHCRGCGARVFLIGLRWHNPDGTRHRCAA